MSPLSRPKLCWEQVLTVNPPPNSDVLLFSCCNKPSQQKQLKKVRACFVHNLRCSSVMMGKSEWRELEAGGHRNRESSDPQRANLPTSLKMLPPGACSESHPADSTAFPLTERSPALILHTLANRMPMSPSSSSRRLTETSFSLRWLPGWRHETSNFILTPSACRRLASKATLVNNCYDNKEGTTRREKKEQGLNARKMFPHFQRDSCSSPY